MPRFHLQTGQAAVEFVVLLPLAAVLLAVGWQVVLAGHAVWAAQVAARAAARAEAVGADPRAAALDHLPARLERDLKVLAGDDGRVHVRLRVPVILSALPLLTAGASAHFEPQAVR
jgi:hypothetical protein